MEVQFRRTGERRYAVTIFRPGNSALEMNPAPGYDSFMPHDLLHFIVESELGLRRGIYGQIAEGGHAGTFHSVGSNHENRREAARQRKRLARRGEKLLREGRDESAISEQAAYVCFYEWLSRSTNPELRKLAAQISRQAKQIQALQQTIANRGLTEDVVSRICDRLDDLSKQWARLDVGESLTVRWPKGN